MKEYYAESAESALADLGTTPNGLSDEEAAKRLTEYGENKLKEGKKISLARRFVKQLLDPMIIVLCIAAVVSLVVAIIEGGEGIAEVVIIAVVVLLNAVLGVVQESKADSAIEALKEMTAATSKVLRGGRQLTVKSSELTVGDVVVLEAGDAVPADLRLIESASMKIEESAMTGESVPAEKKTDPLKSGIALGDRRNMAYSGSTVVYGRGRGVVTAVGMDTEMGKIAGVLADVKEEKTPLQRKLGQLSKLLTYIILGICAVVFVVRLVTAGELDARTVLDSFIIAVSLAVAAIPEGMAMVVTLTLSMGVMRMSKKNAVIRRQSAVETLGCAEIICTDKTGTLTQNKMTVVDHVGDEKLLARALALCSDARPAEGGAIGEPTECALVNYASAVGLDKTAMEAETPRIGEVPFDSERKMMTTIHRTPSGNVRYTKGAPDEVLARCTHALEGGRVVPMTDKLRAAALADNKRMADRALRVLAAAYAENAGVITDKSEDMEKDLVYIGLVGMIDPVRHEVKEAVERCREAGIRPVMITGDHLDTAVAIAMELGIITDRSQAITGADMAKIPDDEFADRVTEFSVYARVQPEHKTRIVRAWKARGCVTAMTGDGVNDAPSIKSADIGIGMGITGTDVTKSAADMVLADDNFATIVTAVGEGRRIYDNIRKAISFLLSSNLAEVVAIFFATMLGFTILDASHLLWINLIGDTVPAIALGMEEAEDDVMKRPPRPAKAGIFADGLGADVLVQGAFLSVITVLAYFLGHGLEQAALTGAFVWEIPAETSQAGMTTAFLTLALAKLFHIFNARSRTHSIFTMKKQNKFVWLAFAASFALTVAVVYIPGIRDAFGFTPISAAPFAVALGLAFSIIPFVEICKLVRRASERRRKLAARV